MTDDSDREPAPEPARVALRQLRKASRVATCSAQAHPLRVEVVTAVDGDIGWTQVARSTANAEHVGAVWREAFLGKGWRE